VSPPALPFPSYCCPRCRHDLAGSGDAYACARCPATYPIVFGIPDFRTRVPPDEKAREDEAVAALIAEYARAASFADLLKPHLMRTTTPYLLGVEFRYEVQWQTRSRDIEARIEQLRSETGWAAGSGACLDVGCGKGAMLKALAARFPATVGLEYSLEYLILARKLLETEHIENVSLVCASAEEIPFADGTFDMTVAVDVIEHLRDADRAAREMHRTLRAGGLLYLNSPNRYNAFTPEGHVQLMWVGFLPRRWAERYVQWRKKAAYEGIWLKSYKDLRRVLSTLAGEHHVLGVMPTRSGARHSMAKRLLLKHPYALRLLNALFKPMIPGYNVLFRKA
jgi:ubiquinone/menaquinone biosynthesis C-methylase UbiE